MKRASGRPLGVLALLAATSIALPGEARAQASPNVPVDDAAYRDLDVLVAQGMAGPLILGQRPYSRLTFARAAAAARSGLGAGEDPPGARVAEALHRLEVRFARELEQLCERTGDGTCEGPRTAGARYLALRQVSLDAAAADAPFRAIPWQLTSALDADVSPLLQRNQGRVLADGWTLGGEARVDAVLGSRVAVGLAPRSWVEHGARASADAEGASGASPDAALLAASVRVLLGNLSVEVGRHALRHGHARELGPVLSANPRGLDQVRLSMERPGRLPWIFRGLGPVAFTALVADMGRDQDTPGSKLIVFAGAVRPHPDLELGGALLNHQGGGVDPDASFGDRVLDALFIVPRRPFYFLPGRGVKSDKLAALDARLTLPDPGLELFVELLTTDDHDVFRAPRQALWHDAAWTAGARAWALGAEGRWDVWAEGSRVGLLPYTHHEFTSGLTLDRRVLGSPLGPLGTGIVGGVDRVGGRGTVSVAGAWERYSGDTYRNPDDGRSWRFRVADNPDEIRVRGTLGWAGHAGPPGLATSVRLGWERVTRFALGASSRSNTMAQVRVTYTW